MCFVFSVFFLYIWDICVPLDNFLFTLFNFILPSYHFFHFFTHTKNLSYTYITIFPNKVDRKYLYLYILDYNRTLYKICDQFLVRNHRVNCIVFGLGFYNYRFYSRWFDFYFADEKVTIYLIINDYCICWFLCMKRNLHKRYTCWLLIHNSINNYILNFIHIGQFWSMLAYKSI